jgi:hypothetical protein
VSDLTLRPEPPTRPGWYWFRGNINGSPLLSKRIVEIQQNKHYGLAVVSASPWPQELDRYRGEWAGPIPEPEEASRA